jgi:fumarate hydratase class I
MQVQWEADMSVTDMCNEGIRRAYLNPGNVLRASILADPDGARSNTGDNTPGVIHYEIVPGDTVEVHVAAKGGGSEAKSKFAMLNPSDSVVDWVLNMVPQMGAGWCPPGMLGIGIGGTAEKAMILAKEALLEPIDIHDLQERGASNRAEELRLELYEKVNRLGIGAQGLGGLTTVMDVKVRDYPSHAANKAVAIIPNCAATRHTHFTLDGNGPARLEAPKLEDWPEVTRETGDNVKRVNLDTVTYRNPGRGQDLETGRYAVVKRQDADRTRRCAQENDRYACQ